MHKAGHRVRITAQLVDALSGAHLWADRFDGSLEARSSKRRRALSCRSTRCSELRRGTDEDGGIDPPGDLSWREETFHLSLAWGSVHNRKNGR